VVPGFWFVCFLNGNPRQRGSFFKICGLGVRVKISKRSFEPFVFGSFVGVFGLFIAANDKAKLSPATQKTFLSPFPWK